MTKDKLIVKQALKLEDLKEKSKSNKALLKTINNRFVGMGQPLNDNVLKMNNYQMQWAYELKELIDQIEY